MGYFHALHIRPPEELFSSIVQRVLFVLKHNRFWIESVKIDSHAHMKKPRNTVKYRGCICRWPAFKYQWNSIGAAIEGEISVSYSCSIVFWLKKSEQFCIYLAYDLPEVLLVFGKFVVVGVNNEQRSLLVIVYEIVVILV
jgi:hypothetical protein